MRKRLTLTGSTLRTRSVAEKGELAAQVQGDGLVVGQRGLGAELIGERLQRRGFVVGYIRAEGTPGDSDRRPRINVIARREGRRPGPCTASQCKRAPQPWAKAAASNCGSAGH